MSTQPLYGGYVMPRAFSEQDILSRTFGYLKPLGLVHGEIGGKPARYWRCGCSCGKEVIVWQHSLVRPDGVKSCGDRIHRIEDLSGRRLGRLVVLKLAPQSAKKYRGAVWVCDCDCGRKEVLIRGRKLQEDIPSCGCWAKEHLRQAVKLPYGEAGVGILFSSYRCGARGRKLYW
ncbi:MAG: hypothetical protein WCB19_05150, partial [Thermoplasmata archaeon]